MANPTDDDLKHVIRQTHQQGGLVVANHIIWDQWVLQNPPTREQLEEWGVDYIEVVNGDTFDWQSISFGNQILIISQTNLHFLESIAY